MKPDKLAQNAPSQSEAWKPDKLSQGVHNQKAIPEFSGGTPQIKGEATEPQREEEMPRSQ